jgi:hypothetical protein
MANPTPVPNSAEQLPMYFVPKKSSDRRRWIMQFLDHVSGTDVLGYIKPRRRMYQRYYDLFNNIFDVNEYKYVWATFGDVKPMTFTNYPLLNPIIQFIAGQFQQHTLAFTAYQTNPNAITQRADMEAELLFLQLVKPYWEQFQQKTGQQITLDDRMDILPENIKTYMTYDFRDLNERVVTDGLTYIITKHNVQSQFAQMLLDLTITGDIRGHIEFIDGDPVPMRDDPRTKVTDRPPDENVYSIIGQDWNPQFDFTETYMNVADVLYNFEYYMDDEQIKKLKALVASFTTSSNSVNQWNTTVCKYYVIDSEGLKIRVLQGSFLARNSESFPKMFDEATGEPESLEDSKLSEDIDIMDVYEGVRIGHDTYCKMQRQKNIIRTGNNWKKAQLNTFGATTKFGLFDKCYQLQMLYNIVLSHMEFAINQAGGKAIVVYTDDMPVGEDGKPSYSLKELAYQAKVQGFILRQRKESPTPQGAPDNYQQVDFGLSQSFSNLLQFKIMIEQTVARMTGVSPDQLGFSNPYQTKGATESNIVQSNSVLQPIYFVLSKVIETALQKTADLMRVLWKENDTRAFVLGDMGYKTIQVPESLSLESMGIFLLNTADDARKKELYMRIGEQALATDATLWKEIIMASEATSSIEARKIIENGIDTIRQLQQQQQAQAAQGQDQQSQIAQAALEQKHMEAQEANAAMIEGKRISAEGQVESALISKETALDTADMQLKTDLAGKIIDAQKPEAKTKPAAKPKPK